MIKIIAKLVTNLFFSLFYRVEFHNAGRVPAQGAVLLCATHNNMLDMFFLGYRLKRWIHWMAKEELFKNPLAGFIFKKLGAFPINRGRAGAGSIKTAYKILENGGIVGIFPHGTRVKKENRKTAAVKSGAAMIAVNSAAVIVPATVNGSYKLFSKIDVYFGEPFRIKTDAEKAGSDELAEYSKLIMDRIFLLSEEGL